VISFAGKVIFGSFLVDETGRISPRVTERPPSFSVRWRGRRIGVRLQDDRIALRASLGMVPSTAALPNHALRARSFEAVQWLSSRLPTGWRVEVPPDYRVNIEAETMAGMLPTAISLIAEVTRFILELDPFLDFLDEHGLAPGPRAEQVTEPARQD
jgi:hypothetical protein